MGDNIHEVEIKQVMGHWEVNVNGEFFCSADTYTEAVHELMEVYS